MRKSKPKKRIVLPDPVYGDVRVTKFVNHLMYDGKKNTAFAIFYTALETVKSKLPNEELGALEIWKKALENVTPQVEVKSRRVGGAAFQVLQAQGRHAQDGRGQPCFRALPFLSDFPLNISLAQQNG